MEVGAQGAGRAAQAGEGTSGPRCAIGARQLLAQPLQHQRGAVRGGEVGGYCAPAHGVWEGWDGSGRSGENDRGCLTASPSMRACCECFGLLSPSLNPNCKSCAHLSCHVS